APPSGASAGAGGSRPGAASGESMAIAPSAITATPVRPSAILAAPYPRRGGDRPARLRSAFEMPGRVVFFLQSATYEPAYSAASMGITAAAMGDEVYFVLSFEELR